MSPNNEDYIVWIDLELTGLEVDTCHILEVASVITDKNLNVASEEYNIVIHQPDQILESMDEWCTNYHAKTGLTEESRSSKIDLKCAEEMLLNFLRKYVPKGKCPLAGNTIYMDRRFIHKYMPSVDDYLHYRIIDVSTIKELAKRWNLTAYETVPGKVLQHRALSDIKESIQELQYYKDHIFLLSSK